MLKTEIITRTEGRDKGKVFLITEMPAYQAYEWATRALFYISQGGVNLPENALQGGMESIGFLGISFLYAVNVELALPLLRQLRDCVQIVESNITRKPTEDDIEDYRTYFWLQGEVIRVITGFSPADVKSTSTPGSATASASSGIQTSGSPSATS